MLAFRLFFYKEGDYPPIDTQKKLCTYQKIIFGQRLSSLWVKRLYISLIHCFCNNTSYLIQMLGAVGNILAEPVVSPHRIKQVCKPYHVWHIHLLSRLVRRLPNGISKREVLMRNCYAVTLRIFVLCLYSVVLQEQKSFGVSFALVSAHRATLCTDTKAKNSVKS